MRRLVLPLLALAVLGLVLCLPRWAGPGRPAGEGREPQLPVDAGGKLPARDPGPGTAAPGPIATRPAAAAGTATSHIAPPPAIIAAPPQEAEALAALAAAEDRLLALDWPAAAQAGRRGASLDASPDTRGRLLTAAADADGLAALFRGLDERDELARDPASSPGLVLIGDPPMPAVAMQSPDVPVETDALAWIEAHRRQGEILFLLQTRNAFMAAPLDDAAIGRVRPADIAAVRSGSRKALAGRLARLEAGEAAKDALAWYAAGRFAYRQRLDAEAVPPLRRALALAPDLVPRVREDRAQTLVAQAALKQRLGNHKQAAQFLGILQRRYGETRAAREARLLAEGKVAELRAEVAAAPEPPRPAPDPASAPPPALIVPTDLAAAETLGAESQALAAQLLDLPHSKEREGLILAALAKLRPALAGYRQAMDAPDGDRLFPRFNELRNCETMLRKMVSGLHD